jgi:hypothetical protein
MGDDDNTGTTFTGNAKNGKIDGNERAAYTGDYLLIGPGPDETFGPPKLTEPISSTNQCDDVTHFAR